MNTSNLYALKTFTESDSMFHANDFIEVRGDEGSVQLKLDQIFGAVGLKYQVAVECYGVVDTVYTEDTGALRLYVGQYAKTGQCAQVVVRAEDEVGESTAMTFKVVVWPSVACELVSA